MSAVVSPSTTILRRQGKRRNKAARIANAAVKTSAFQKGRRPSKQPANTKLLSKAMNRPASSRSLVESRTGAGSSGAAMAKDGGGYSSSPDPKSGGGSGVVLTGMAWR